MCDKCSINGYPTRSQGSGPARNRHRAGGTLLRDRREAFGSRGASLTSYASLPKMPGQGKSEEEKNG